MSYWSTEVNYRRLSLQTKSTSVEDLQLDKMRRCWFLLVLFLTWDRISGAQSSTCNTVWRSKANVYMQAPRFAGSRPDITGVMSCMATCTKKYPGCTGFEYRKTNCWIHTKPIIAEKLIEYTGTVQFYRDQKCNPEFCSTNWLEIGTDYPKGYPLTDYDKGHRGNCLNLCVAKSSDSPSSCGRVFYCPMTGGLYEPFGSSCTLEKAGEGPAPKGCIEYKIIERCA